MKICIIGSDNLFDLDLVKETIKESRFDVTEIVLGGEVGFDKYAELMAKQEGYDITIFKPNFKKYGRTATYIRNQKMIDYSEAAIIIYYGTISSINALETIKRNNIPYYAKKVNKMFYKEISATKSELETGTELMFDEKM